MKEIQEKASAIRAELAKVIVAQNVVIEEIIIALFTGGHILLEGVPGVAKTLIFKTFALISESSFKRIQFTPDLMPSDIVGTYVFNIKDSTFVLRRGPIFANFILADEINRTPPKTQSALLEAMQEGQVTIEGETYKLPEVFMVCATQNPIEYEGTYPLPEAQIDRFLIKVQIVYPKINEEIEILKKYHKGFNPYDETTYGVNRILTCKEIIAIRKKIEKVVVEEKIFEYITRIASETRQIKHLILGASPRATISLLLASKAAAAIWGKEYITPDIVKRMAFPVLRHRLLLKPESQIEGITADDTIREILSKIEVPR